MASKDQRRGKETPANGLMASFQWADVLSTVKDQIPSMDSDVLTSDEEDGELFIFQRDQSNLIPDLSEELEEITPEKARLQKTFEFMRHPGEIWNENEGHPTFEKDSTALQSASGGHRLLEKGGLDLLTEEMSGQQAIAPSEFSTDEHKSGQGTSGAFSDKERNVRKDDCSELGLSLGMSPSAEESPFLMLGTSEKERRKLIETKILCKAALGLPSGNVDHPESKNNNNSLERTAKSERELQAEHRGELMLLGFKEIEKWDLDKILNDLEMQNDSHTSWITETTFPSTNHETFRAVSQAKLMGKLKELSLQQSRAHCSRHRKCLAKLPHFSQCQGDGRDVPFPALVTTGRSQTPAVLQFPSEPPTVYIDLRDALPQASQVLDTEEQSSSDSATDEEEDTEVAGQETVGERTKESPQPSPKNCSGKSALLQQLRCFRRRMSQSLAIAQEKGKTPGETDLPDVRRQHLKLKPARLESSREGFSLLNHVTRAVTPSREFKEETEKGAHSEFSQDASSADKEDRRNQAGKAARGGAQETVIPGAAGQIRPSVFHH